MRKNGGYDFGPSMHKPTLKKGPTELMKRSLKQLKKTRECYMVSMAIKYKNDNGQGFNANRRTNNFTRSLRPNNGMTSSSKLLRKNTKISMPSSSKPNNGAVSFRRTTKSSSSLKNAMACLQNNAEKSRQPSSRTTNGIHSSHKNTNGGAPPLKNIEEPRPSSSRLKNGQSSPTKNTDMRRSSSLRLNNDKVSPPKNIKKSMTLSKLYNGGLVPPGKNNESLKSRPSCLRNGSFSVVKDDSNSMLGILKESQPSSMFGNSRIALQNVNGEHKKDSMDKHIQLQSRKRKFGLFENGRTDADKFKSTRRKPLLEKKLETHGVDDDGAQNLVCAEKGIAGLTKSMNCSFQHENQNIILAEDGRTIDEKLSKRTELLSGENPETHEGDHSEEAENRKPTTRRRRLLLNDDDDDDDGDHNLAGVEIDTPGLTTQTSVVSKSFLSEPLKLQQYGSLPIDEPAWSGIVKISSKKTVSLAAHLSTKCCEEGWKLAGSLQPEIVVKKLSRMEAWPKSFEASRPTDDNIALYFLPCKIRQHADLDLLVKEIVENDMVLQAVIGEAEMLIFPSILLPEQHKTFQGKPYLWAVFKRGKNKVATVEAQQHGKGRCPPDEMGKQQASHCSVDKEVHRVTGLNMDGGLEAAEEVERQGIEREQNPSVARANAPSPTTDATMSENHGIHPSLAVPTGAFFGFVVQSNPRVEQLIQEMQHEGAVMVAMRGEMIGSGLGQATAAGRKEDEMPQSSS